MTIEDAIEYWEGLRKTFSSQIEKEENCFGRMHLQTTVDALDIAISALRAQQQLESNLKALESNEPLTVDELREMDGEPVYIHSDTFPGDCGWRVVKKASVLDIQFTDGDCFLFIFYGKSWIAYRRKPQEV